MRKNTHQIRSRIPSSRRSYGRQVILGVSLLTIAAVLSFGEEDATKRAHFKVTMKTSAPVEEQSKGAPVRGTRTANFPAFLHATFPVKKIPNWGAMRSAAEWNRSYDDMNPSDFVPVPKYDLKRLTMSMYNLSRDLQEVHLPIVTEKVFYSTRDMGRYHPDSNEFEGIHPGIDLKLAPETPVGAVAGGRVHATDIDPYLGSYVMIEHILPDTKEHVVSIYGHLASISVEEGQTVKPGSLIGYVGSTGRSSGPHLHLQIDYKKGPERHEPYVPSVGSGPSEVSKWMIHPIEFIVRYPKD